MVGVTSPLFRAGQARAGLWVGCGYLAGTMLAAVLVWFGLSLVAMVTSAVPTPLRYDVAAAGIAALLALDLLGKTPSAGRQTVQRFALLPAAFRGFVWGLDIGLLLTTIKVTSVVWALLIISIASPSIAPVALVVFYGCLLIAEGAAAAMDVRLGPDRVFQKMQRPSHLMIARFVSVCALAAAVVGIAASVP